MTAKTENTTENIDELDAAKKVKEENILDEQQQAEIGPEGKRSKNYDNNCNLYNNINESRKRSCGLS